VITQSSSFPIEMRLVQNSSVTSELNRSFIVAAVAVLRAANNVKSLRKNERFEKAVTNE
jgi:hypothetical protein